MNPPGHHHHRHHYNNINNVSSSSPFNSPHPRSEDEVDSTGATASTTVSSNSSGSSHQPLDSVYFHGFINQFDGIHRPAETSSLTIGAGPGTRASATGAAVATATATAATAAEQDLAPPLLTRHKSLSCLKTACNDQLENSNGNGECTPSTTLVTSVTSRHSSYHARNGATTSSTGRFGRQEPIPHYFLHNTPKDLKDKPAERNAMHIQSSTIFTEVGPTSHSVAFPIYSPRKNGLTNVNGVPPNGRHRHLPSFSPFAIAAGQAIPHVSINETQKYTFAMVLKHPEQVFRLLRKRFPTKSSYAIRHDLYQQVSQLQQKCIRRLIQAGLGVVLLDNEVRVGDPSDELEDLAMKNICVLIDPKRDPELLVHEFKREMDELAIQQGQSIERLGEETIDCLRASMCFSPALELQLTHNIIQNAIKDYDKEEWVVDVNKELTIKDVLVDCFPLHDRQFNKQFFAEYRKNTFDFKWQKTTTGNCERWAVEELRLHFGERVAFLFAFMHIYSKHLTPMTVVCVVFYLTLRFWPGFRWRDYMQGLAILGFSVACIWAPSFLICWQRETNLLVEKWNLTKYKNTVYEKNDYNPDFQYVWVKNEITNEMEKVRKVRNSYLLQITMLFYVMVSALVQCVCLLPFIQWYVYAKNAPTCDECRSRNDKGDVYQCMWFMTCFINKDSSVGTDRWVYILIQGIALGLLIDIIFFEIFNWVSEKFVRWENYQKKSDYENRLIHRRFVFVWSNWFFWFLFLAFVYLPFGDTFLSYFHKVGLKSLAPYKFEPEKLNLDTLFVTPLVVTQFLNMLLETLVPYLMRRLRGRPVTCRKFSPVGQCFKRMASSWCRKHSASEHDRREHRLTARKLSELVQKRTGFRVDVMEAGDDSNQYTAYEIIGESKLPAFDTVFDYLDATIQFSYVVMFTVVWPLLPFPALVNNVLEVRGDAFRLLFGQRRPMPRRDTSIGEWFTVLGYANIIGVTVVTAFLVMYHMGYFLTSCNYHISDGPMVPFSQANTTDAQNPMQCKEERAMNNYLLWETGMFIVLEHFGFCVRYLVLQINAVPSVIRSNAYNRIKQISMLTATKTADAAQFEYIRELRQLFDKYDVERDGHLRERELIPFLAEWILKHPSELLPYSSIIFRYMDKPLLGKVPFATCCLMLQHVNHDRFFACMLGIYDPMHGAVNDEIRRASNAMEFRRVMSVASSSRASEIETRRSLVESSHHEEDDEDQNLRNSSFFYVFDKQPSPAQQESV